MTAPILRAPAALKKNMKFSCCLDQPETLTLIMRGQVFSECVTTLLAGERTLSEADGRSHIVQVVFLLPFLAVFHPKMLYWLKMTGAVFQIKVSAEFVLKQFSEVLGLDGYSGSLYNTIVP